MPEENESRLLIDPRSGIEVKLSLSYNIDVDVFRVWTEVGDDFLPLYAGPDQRRAREVFESASQGIPLYLDPEGDVETHEFVAYDPETKEELGRLRTHIVYDPMIGLYRVWQTGDRGVKSILSTKSHDDARKVFEEIKAAYIKREAEVASS